MTEQEKLGMEALEEISGGNQTLATIQEKASKAMNVSLDFVKENWGKILVAVGIFAAGTEVGRGGKDVKAAYNWATTADNWTTLGSAIKSLFSKKETDG